MTLKSMFIPLTLIGIVTAGCGGGGGVNPPVFVGNSGKAVFNIAWPSRSKPGSPLKPNIIPAASNSIDITLTDSSGNVTDSGPIVKPTATWTSPQLAPGTYAVAATAYPGTAAGSLGVPQATGQTSVTITAGNNTSGNLTMGSTVSQLTISPASPIVNINSTTTLSVQATDKTGAVVLVDPSTVSWTSSAPGVASVSATGLTPTVTGLAGGSVSIGATFTEVEPTLGQTPVSSTPVTLSVQAGTVTIGVNIAHK